MQTNKTRTPLVISSILTLALGAGLIVAFVLISFEGMINDFAYFGVLANFTELMGIIGLCCLFFGLFCLKLAEVQFKLSKKPPIVYKKGKYKLICSLVVYVTLMVVGAFCLFETYNDYSAVGQAFLNANIGLAGLAVLVLSVMAFILLIVDMATFAHDIKNGLIDIREGQEPQLLLNAPQYKLIYNNDEKIIDYSKLETKIKKLDELKKKGVITEDEYAEMKRKIIDSFF